MRADRLVSLVLLLRQRGLTSASALARELEVSRRTVLRDVEALSTAGVPIYAQHGRNGGFALLPGLRTELTGVNDDEAVAMLALASRRRPDPFGVGTTLGSALRKVIDALPDRQRVAAADRAQRLLVAPETDLLPRRSTSDDITPAVLVTVRRAVTDGNRLRLRYAARDQEPAWRVVDPIGLVTTGGRSYLLALRDGADRIYRLSRILDAAELDEPAQRPDRVDLDRLWRERCRQFLADDHLRVVVRVTPPRRDALLQTAVTVRSVALADTPDDDGRVRLEVTYQDAWHAEWALWQLGPDADVLSPRSLRAALHTRATAMASRYRPGATDDVPTSGER